MLLIRWDEPTETYQFRSTLLPDVVITPDEVSVMQAAHFFDIHMESFISDTGEIIKEVWFSIKESDLPDADREKYQKYKSPAGSLDALIASGNVVKKQAVQHIETFSLESTP